MQRRKTGQSAWHELKGEGYAWINVTEAKKSEINRLGRRFGFLETVDLVETLPPLQRAKILERPEYLFMVLLFPVYNHDSGIIEPHEIDFYIMPKTLVTVHNGALEPVGTIYGECVKSERSRRVCLAGTPLTLLSEILGRLLTSLSPMLVHIGRDIDEVEKNIFDARRRDTILEILRIKTNIVNFRKAISAHKNVIRHLISLSSHRFDTHKLHVLLENLVDQTKEVWDLLDNYKDTIEAIHTSHQSILEARSNDIMRVLTMFSVVIFPLSLIAGIFGMNTHVPFVGTPHDFWIAIGIMGVVAIAMFVYFKRKKWL